MHEGMRRVASELLMNGADCNVLSRAIRLANFKEGYFIRGLAVQRAAERLRSFGYVTVKPILPKHMTTRHCYVAVKPTKKGRQFWQDHLIAPRRKPAGGANKVLSIQTLRATKTALLATGTPARAAAVLGVCRSTIVYRMMRLNKM